MKIELKETYQIKCKDCGPIEGYRIKPSMFMTMMGLNQGGFSCPKCDGYNMGGIDDSNTYIEGTEIHHTSEEDKAIIKKEVENFTSKRKNGKK